ncbi:hypothetical protein [Streptomyces abikoensis]|uniref:hypothetical protein n=1 Tax=Streptomyces abikoensis TaxID=97398 RepID=UPI00167A65C0|nr:hypothetical protein [Streptomyces abikoensis]GGP55132.1 hypothetical protein GCM10010214_30340 [Streptomyces abikoensis]
MVMGADTPVARILTVLDPPDHTRVRKLAMGAFTPRRVAQWREPTERIVAASLDALAASERPDVVEYASAIPAAVIGEILGIPMTRYNDMLHAIDRAFPPDDDGLAEALKSGLTSPEDIEAAEDVVGCCPTEAITLLGLDEDGNGGEEEGTAAGR